MWLWHIPALYNLTLRDEMVHNLEHTAFLAVGLLFWTAALPRPNEAATLGLIGRSVVVLTGLVGSWLLAVYIGYAPGVLYAYSGSGSSQRARRPAARRGVMWVPASVPFVAAVVWIMARWFENDARLAAAEARGSTEAHAHEHARRRPAGGGAAAAGGSRHPRAGSSRATSSASPSRASSCCCSSPSSPPWWWWRAACPRLARSSQRWSAAPAPPGGSGALNCWWDRDIDSVMRRTANRPLPSGRLRPWHAVAFGLALNALAAVVLWWAASAAAAALALLGTAYYVGVYTMTLKRRTPQNIVIGGAAGAVPVLVGSVIATGRIGWLAVVFFAHRVLLDAAPLLGARAGVPPRLRGRDGADAPRHHQRAGDAPRHPRLPGRPRRRQPASRAGLRPAVRGPGGRAQRLLPGARRPRAARREACAAPLACSTIRSCTWPRSSPSVRPQRCSPADAAGAVRWPVRASTWLLR